MQTDDTVRRDLGQFVGKHEEQLAELDDWIERRLRGIREDWLHGELHGAHAEAVRAAIAADSELVASLIERSASWVWLEFDREFLNDIPDAPCP